jgi:hypothetical protein
MTCSPRTTRMHRPSDHAHIGSMDRLWFHCLEALTFRKDMFLGRTNG